MQPQATITTIVISCLGIKLLQALSHAFPCKEIVHPFIHQKFIEQPIVSVRHWLGVRGTEIKREEFLLRAHRELSTECSALGDSNMPRPLREKSD